MHLLHSRWDHVLLRRLQWWRFSAQDVSCSQSSCCLLLLPGDIRKVKERLPSTRQQWDTDRDALKNTHTFFSFLLYSHLRRLNYLQSFLLNESRSWRRSPPQNILLLDRSDLPTLIWRFTAADSGSGNFLFIKILVIRPYYSDTCLYLVFYSCICFWLKSCMLYIIQVFSVTW